MKYWVYIHVFPNGKRYVGCTKLNKPEWRWGPGGKKYSTQKVYRAILKYGWDNITHEVFEVDSEEEMYYLEKYFISYYKTINQEFGYNLSVGGEKSSLGCKRTGEYLEKIREFNKRKAQNPEFRKKQSLSHRGKKMSLSLEERERRANFILNSPNWQKNHVRGRTLSEETKSKMTKSLRLKYENEDYKKYHREHCHRYTEEEKKKLSEARKGIKKSEETKKRMQSAALSRAKITIELPDGSIRTITKPNLVKVYIKTGKEFKYVE